MSHEVFDYSGERRQDVGGDHHGAGAVCNGQQQVLRDSTAILQPHTLDAVRHQEGVSENNATLDGAAARGHSHQG